MKSPTHKLIDAVVTGLLIALGLVLGISGSGLLLHALWSIFLYGWTRIG